MSRYTCTDQHNCINLLSHSQEMIAMAEAGYEKYKQTIAEYKTTQEYEVIKLSDSEYCSFQNWETISNIMIGYPFPIFTETKPGFSEGKTISYYLSGQNMLALIKKDEISFFERHFGCTTEYYDAREPFAKKQNSFSKAAKAFCIGTEINLSETAL